LGVRGDDRIRDRAGKLPAAKRIMALDEGSGDDHGNEGGDPGQPRSREGSQLYLERPAGRPGALPDLRSSEDSLTQLEAHHSNEARQ
jgi:hypothetical protein